METAEVAGWGRERLIEALQGTLETLYSVADALGTVATERDILLAVQEILNDAESAREGAEEEGNLRAEAEEKLENKLQADLQLTGRAIKRITGYGDELAEFGVCLGRR